ncbi:MAG: hypothetical protein AB8B69_18735 [Chitinophagales bacterium]
MTAIVGIINPQGAAIAADSTSTLTIGSKVKTADTANKLFALSKYHPVGIMIYNAADFMGLSWEAIIKAYRSDLGENSFDTLDEYKLGFLDFLSNIKNKWNIPQRSVLAHFNLVVYKLVVEKIQSSYNQRLKQNQGSNNPIDIYFSCVSDLLNSYESGVKHHGLMLSDNNWRNSYTSLIQQFINQSESVLKKTDQNFSISTDQKDQFIALIKAAINSNNFAHYTGIGFIGFGEKELLPSCLNIQIDGLIDDKLKFTQIQSRDLINNTAWIIPFAQWHESNNVVHGIHPVFKDFIHKQAAVSFANMQNELFDFVKDKIPTDTSQLEQELEQIQIKHKNTFINSLKNHENNSHVQKIFASINFLQPYELAELAESLVRITYLKLKFSSDATSVGGPIDVAVITKGDGFIWVKRKHYFKPELNYAFFNTYLK